MAAYAIFFVMIAIVAMGLIAITSNVVVDEFITSMNPFISAGEVSTQWTGYWNFGIGIFMAFPIIGLFVLGIWAIVRSIERKSQEGFN